MDAIERVYVAGGFGKLPKHREGGPDRHDSRYPGREIYVYGNTSITGAYLCLLSKELRNEAAEDSVQDDLRGTFGFKDVHGRICIGTVSAPHKYEPISISCSTTDVAMTPMNFGSWLILTSSEQREF